MTSILTYPKPYYKQPRQNNQTSQSTQMLRGNFVPERDTCRQRNTGNQINQTNPEEVKKIAIIKKAKKLSTRFFGIGSLLLSITFIIIILITVLPPHPTLLIISVALFITSLVLLGIACYHTWIEFKTKKELKSLQNMSLQSTNT